MAHNMTDIFFDTLWDHLSDGLKQRIVSAVKKPKGSGQKGVVVDSLSNEHRDEIDWLAAREGTGQDAPFIAVNLGSGNKARAAIRLTDDMVEYVEKRVLRS